MRPVGEAGSKWDVWDVPSYAKDKGECDRVCCYQRHILHRSPEGDEGVSQGDSPCKGPGAGLCLTWWRSNQEACVAVAE